MEERWCPVIAAVTTLMDGGGMGTLRWAMGQVNASNDANNTIHFDNAPDGIVNLLTPLPPITHSAGINKIVEMRGRGRANTNVARNVLQAFRIFEVAAVPGGSTLNVIISQMTMSNGLVNAAMNNTGGGILNRGNALTLDDVAVSGNVATAAGAGIMHLNGTLTIRNSFVTSNGSQIAAAPLFGGGISSAANTTVTIEGSSIGNNYAERFGGGIHNDGGIVTIQRGMSTSGSAVYANRARSGGGIANARDGRVRIIQSGVIGNVAEDAAAVGGGIHNVSKHAEFGVIIDNSVIDANEARGVGGQGGRGGGIYNQGTFRIRGTDTSSTSVTINLASLAGGGIFNTIDPSDQSHPTLIIDQSTISDNRVLRFGYGAGIYNSSFGPDQATFGLQVSRSTIARNQFDAMNGGFGGGVFIAPLARATLSNTTGSGNRASLGAGIFGSLLSVVQTRNVTVASNTAEQGGTGQGGGVFLEANAQFDMANTIIAGNAADQYPDVLGAMTSLGHNLIGDGTGGSGFRPDLGDQVGFLTQPYVIDPLLSELGYYGGPTETHVLLAGSPALDAGDIALAALPYDQRGYLRVFGLTVDIGAVEMQDGEQMSTLLRGLRPIRASRRLR